MRATACQVSGPHVWRLLSSPHMWFFLALVREVGEKVLGYGQGLP